MKIITASLDIMSSLLQKTSLLEKNIRSNKFAYNFIFVAILMLIYCLVLFLNMKTVLTGDDYVYSFLYQTPHRLSSIGDIFESQRLHYLQWGGRSVVHFIAQVLLFINNPLIIDVINSLAFVVFIYAIYYHITAGKRTSISLLVVVFTLTWLLQPAFAETVLWITGSANYLWGTLIILLFLLPYRLYSGSKISIAKQVAYCVLMLLGGVIAGWTNENTAAAMIMMELSFMLYYSRKKWHIPVWMYSGLMGAIIGYIIMVVAPGNFVRAEGTSIDPFLIVYRTLTHTHSLVNYLGVLNLGIAVLLIMYLKFTDKEKREILPYIIIFFIGVFISVYVMVVSPGFPPRAWFGTITFNIIILGIVLYKLDYQLSLFRQIRNSILVFCIVSFGFSFYDAYNDVTTIDEIWKERMLVLEQKKADETDSVVFKEYYPKTKFGLGDTPYALKYISEYYEIDFQLER